jgi:exonuclease III
MKIASFNINNINRRLSNLLAWLREGEPDVVCLQELKAADTEFPTGGNPAGRLSWGMAWREELEWRGRSGAMGSGCDSYGLAGRRRRPALPLSRSGR